MKKTCDTCKHAVPSSIAYPKLNCMKYFNLVSKYEKCLSWEPKK